MTGSKKARAEYNRYQREWRSKNRDRVKAINQRYWEKRAAMREEETTDGQTDSK